MTQLNEYKARINDYIALAFMLDDGEEEITEETILSRMYATLNSAGVPEDYEEIKEIWDYTEQLAYDLVWGEHGINKSKVS